MFTILRSKCRLLRIPLMAGFLLIAASLVLAPAAEARNARKAHAAQSTASRQILNVRSAVLMDARTGKILYSQNPDVRIPPASLTKIMSMMVTFDAIRSGKVKLSDQIRVSRHAARQGGSRMGLRAGGTRFPEPPPHGDGRLFRQRRFDGLLPNASAVRAAPSSR